MSARLPLPTHDDVAEISHSTAQPPPEKEIIYSSKAKSLCQKLLESEYAKIELAEELCKELYNINVISCEDDYYSVRNNNKFMRPFRHYLSSYLSADIEKSHYGLRVVSDFDLYTNMSTDADFTENQSINKKYAEKLKKNRRNLRSWFHRFVEKVRMFSIHDWFNVFLLIKGEEVKGEKCGTEYFIFWLSILIFCCDLLPLHPFTLYIEEIQSK